MVTKITIGLLIIFLILAFLMIISATIDIIDCKKDRDLIKYSKAQDSLKEGIAAFIGVGIITGLVIYTTYFTTYNVNLL